jgi:hypothetical protein
MPQVLVAVLEMRGEVLLEVLEGLFELVAGVEVLKVVSAQQLVDAPLVSAVGRVSVRLAALEPDALVWDAQHVYQKGVPHFVQVSLVPLEVAFHLACGPQVDVSVELGRQALGQGLV